MHCKRHKLFARSLLALIVIVLLVFPASLSTAQTDEKTRKASISYLTRAASGHGSNVSH